MSFSKPFVLLVFAIESAPDNRFALAATPEPGNSCRFCLMISNYTADLPMVFRVEIFAAAAARKEIMERETDWFRARPSPAMGEPPWAFRARIKRLVCSPSAREDP